MKTKILIIGACGQIGSELTLALRKKHGDHSVVASDIKEGNEELMRSGPFQILDATHKEQLVSCIQKHQINEVYLMAALLSATAEKYPQKAWELNMNSLSHILEIARNGIIKKVFWPSSMAVFGPTTPKTNTPQTTIMEPTSVYGITKLAGERWCEYFYNNYGVDVRSLRYPGIISWKTPPGGGTTDYAVDIYHKAITQGSYECFLSKHTMLPMMYMEDAINATLGIMEADAISIKHRSSYNVTGTSFTPEEVANSIEQYLPGFKMYYKPDFRQQIADTWPDSMDDNAARNDWGWQHEYDLDRITQAMLTNLKAFYQKNSKIF